MYRDKFFGCGRITIGSAQILAQDTVLGSFCDQSFDVIEVIVEMRSVESAANELDEAFFLISEGI